MRKRPVVHAMGRDRRAHRRGKTKGKIGLWQGRDRAAKASQLRGQVGDEPDADQRLDAQVRPFSSAARGRCSSICGVWPAEIGGLSPLSAARMKEWMASDLSGLDLLVIQIDGIHMDEDLILVAATGVNAKGDKHPPGLIEGSTEHADTQA
jgi:hypothetical protein